MLNKKTMLIKKIVLGVSCLIILALLIWYAISYMNKVTNFFFDHFLAFVVLSLIGVIAITMVYGNNKRYSGDKSQDTVMVYVGIGCIILALLSIPFSFIFIG